MLSPYRKGDNEFWDRLGADWWAIEYQKEGASLPRMYLRSEEGEGGRTAITGLCIDGPVTTDVLRAIPVSLLENLLALEATFKADDAARTEALAPLRRNRGDDPDEFAGRVAAQYRQFAARSSSPAKAMAEHSGVPVGTVRGWIREARLRGKLPAGKQGRAG